MYTLRTTLAVLLFALPALVSAAQLHLEQSSAPVRVGDTFILTVMLDSTDGAVNAFEGSLHFLPDLTLQDIRFSGSVVPLWVEKPKQKTTGTVTFAGVLPGGFQEKGVLTTLVFVANNPGIVHISFGADTEVYKDDGKGTRAPLQTTPLSLDILPASGAPHRVYVPDDTTPPEPFVPAVLPGHAFGQEGPVLVFDTQDKDSGILYFEIARSYNPRAKDADLSWQVVQSPYVLSPAQDLDHYLFVRATDRAQHTHTASVPPQKISIALLVRQQWFVILLLLGVIGSVILFFRRGKHRHESV